MLKQSTTILLVTVFAMSAMFTAGCENDAQNTALLGAGIGALIGGDDAATGAAIGAGAGYLIGDGSDKKKAQQQTQQQTDSQIAQLRAEQQMTNVWITNSNGSQIEVKLQKSGPNFIGPKGETYTTMPTESQLRPVYGF
jgi:hypothetical protein